MRIRNISMGRCGHRPLRTTTENQRISRADRVVRPYKGYWIDRVGRAKIAVFPVSRRRGRCLHRPAETSGFTEIRCEFVFICVFRRRGGRPCPPAGIVRYYGKPMRIRNNLKGRCGHRPLRTTTENQRISRADRVVRPYKGYWIDRVGRAKIAVFPVSRRRGRCPHRPAEASGFMEIRCEFVFFCVFRRRGGRPCPPAETVRFMAVFRQIRIDFPFCTVGVDAHIDPPKRPVLWKSDANSYFFAFFAVGADDPVRPYKWP